MFDTQIKYINYCLCWSIRKWSRKMLNMEKLMFCFGGRGNLGGIHLSQLIQFYGEKYTVKIV